MNTTNTTIDSSAFSCAKYPNHSTCVVIIPLILIGFVLVICGWFYCANKIARSVSP